jgi:hypothetical protein
MLGQNHFDEPNWHILTFLHPDLLCMVTSKFSYILFSNPAHKIETETVQTCGRLLIANYMDQSLWLANQKQGAAVRSYLSHSSLAGVRLGCAFYQPQQIVQNAWPKPFWWAKLAYFDFSSSRFIVHGHILSNIGDALRMDNKTKAEVLTNKTKRAYREASTTPITAFSYYSSLQKVASVLHQSSDDKRYQLTE